MFEYNLAAKWIELLREIAPNVTRVGVLRDASVHGIGQFAVIQSVTPSAGADVTPINVRDAAEIERDVAALARYGSYAPEARIHACEVYKGNIEVQCQLWYRNKGAMPAVNLSDIGADVSYFPEGLPQCPVDGSAFTFDPATQKVTGHTH